MKLLRLLLASVIVILCMGINTATAQVTVGTGTGTSSNSPITSCYGYSYSEQIYLQSEIGASGTITSISFYVNSVPATNDESDNWTIYLGHTTKTDFANTTDWETATGMTQAFSGTVTYPAAGNWMTINLTTPFVYNNTDNLIIGVHEDVPGWDCIISWNMTPTASDQVIYYRNDTNDPDPLAPPTATGITPNRANVILGGIQQACPSPSNLGIANLTTTSVDLSWTVGGTETAWNVEYGVAGFTQGNGTVVSTTTNPHPLSALMPSTTYEYYVQADCGGANGTSLWAGPFSFTTFCTPFVAPYTESFDMTTTPNCWSQSATTGGPWVFGTPGFGWNNTGCSGSTPADHTGNGGNYAAIDFSTPDAGVILQMGDIDVSALAVPYLEFYHQMCGSGYSPLNETYIEAFDGTTWTQVGLINTGTASWEKYGFNLSGFTFNTNLVRLRFRAESGGSGSTFYGDVALDDVSVIEAPSCIVSSSLTATNITATSADLGWTAGGTETSWEIEYGAAGFMQGGGTLVVTSNTSYSLTMLAANTSYDYYVRGICGVGDTSSWAGPLSFTTICAAYTPPYLEDFTTGVPPNACWDEADGGQPWSGGPTNLGTGLWGSKNFAANASSLSASINIFTTGKSDWLLSPDYDLTTGGPYQLEYDFGVFNYNGGVSSNLGSDDTIQVFISTDAGATWTSLKVYDNTYVTPTGGSTEVFDLAAYSGSTVRFAVWASEGAVDDPEDVDVQIDNFWVRATPSCIEPSVLTVSNLTLTSADLGWTAGGTETEWQVQYDTAGFTPGTGNFAVTTSNPYAVSNLMPNTPYDFYVRAICGPGDTSAWVSSSFFTGYCMPNPSSVDGQGITNVTMGSINNTTVAETGNYGDYSAQVTDAPQGGILPIDISLNTGITPYIYDFWASVDWNNDLDFDDAGEQVFLGSSSGMASITTTNLSLSIPASAVLGNYRIRIAGYYVVTAGTATHDPCYTGTWAAFEDYTLNVVSQHNLLTPTDNTILTVAGPAQSGVDITWETSNLTMPTYEWRAILPGGSFNNPLVSIPSNNMGMDTVLTLTIQQIDDLLSGLGVNIGDTAMIQWNVLATSGTDSSFAAMPFNLSLARYGTSTPVPLNAPQVSNATTQVRAPNGTAGATFMRASTIVLPAEFASAGIAANTAIRSFGFNTNVPVPAGSVSGVFKVYLQNTTDAAYGKGTAWSGITPGMTLVFDDTITINGGATAWDVVLSTGFNYNGDAVYVAYDWETIGNPLATPITYNANNLIPGSLVSASSAVAAPATLVGSLFRPEFAWGIDRDADDLEVVAIYALGKNSLMNAQQETVQAVIRNNGYLPANKTVSLNITGTNTHTATETVSLLSEETTIVTFASYAIAAAGFSDLTVSVPADMVTANDAQTWVQEVTPNTVAYADSTLTGLGGVGYNTGSGLLLNRYFVDGQASVGKVNMYFSDDVDAVGNTVYAVLVDTSGAIVSQSDNYVITAADLNTWKTFDLNGAVNFDTENIWVGMAQTANAVTGYFPLAFQAENPTRPNAYFTGALTAGATLGTVNGFRLMVEAVLSTTCNTVSSVTSIDEGCAGANDGEATVSISGGTMPYNYTWSNNATTSSVANLGAGQYFVTITDDNNCTSIDSVTISSAPVINISATQTDVSCNGLSDGSVMITVTGGASGFTYAWDNGATTADLTGLAAGTYNGTVTDANNCTETASVTITEPAVLVLTTSSVADTAGISPVGAASVVVTGGTAPYTYTWDNGGVDADLTGLATGTYLVTVTDANNCTETASVTVDEVVSTNNVEYLTSLSIAPNPTRGNTIIDLELSQNADVAVSIYTVTGVLVQDFGKENTSRQTHQIDLSTYANGMYLVRIVIDNQVITKKLMVNK